MWVIFEGADGAGKSTLAAEVTRQLENIGRTVKQVHTGAPQSPETAIAECTEGIFAEYDGSFDLISDRWAWGGPVYGPIYRPALDIDGFGDTGERGWRYMEMFAAARGAITVYVDVDPDVARTRIGFRGDDYIDIKDLEQIVDKYRRVYDMSLTGEIFIRSEHLDQVPTLATSIIVAASKKKMSPLLKSHEKYVGPEKPRTLVVTSPEMTTQLRAIEMYPQDSWKELGIMPTQPSRQSGVRV